MNSDTKSTGSAAEPASGRKITLVGRQVDSREIFQEGREITIVHGLETYRLRLTAQNKLILTK